MTIADNGYPVARAWAKDHAATPLGREILSLLDEHDERLRPGATVEPTAAVQAAFNRVFASFSHRIGSRWDRATLNEWARMLNDVPPEILDTVSASVVLDDYPPDVARMVQACKSEARRVALIEATAKPKPKDDGFAQTAEVGLAAIRALRARQDPSTVHPDSQSTH
jgi:hypothetical protein